METKSELTDEQWRLIADLFPHDPRSRRLGRPAIELRHCVEGILWVLRGGARWKDLPEHFPSYPTCWRRLQAWTAAGIWTQAWARLLRVLDGRGQIGLGKAIADGTFSSATKGAIWSERPSEAKVPRQWSHRRPRHPAFGNRGQCQSCRSDSHRPLLDARVLRRRPQRLIYDRAADSDPLRTRLVRIGIELVCPHRRRRRKPATQDGRKLRRYRRRWKIERSIGWMQNFRRLVTRYEYHAYLFHGFVQLACLVIVLRQF